MRKETCQASAGFNLVICLFVLTRHRVPSPVIVLFTLPRTPMADVASLRAEIKNWERTFTASEGRNPSVDDIKRLPHIGSTARPLILTPSSTPSSTEIQAVQAVVKSRSISARATSQGTQLLPIHLTVANHTHTIIQDTHSPCIASDTQFTRYHQHGASFLIQPIFSSESQGKGTRKTHSPDSTTRVQPLRQPI